MLLPYRISLHELIRQYDHLVIAINQYSGMTELTFTTATTAATSLAAAVATAAAATAVIDVVEAPTADEIATSTATTAVTSSTPDSSSSSYAVVSYTSIQVNEPKASPPPQVTAVELLMDMLDTLRLVCSVLVSYLSQLQQLQSASSPLYVQTYRERCTILESMSRRSWVLQQILQNNGNDYNCETTIRSKNMTSPLIPVQIDLLSGNTSTNDDDDGTNCNGSHDEINESDGDVAVWLEWRYDDDIHQSIMDDDTTTTKTTILSPPHTSSIPIQQQLLTISREDLIEEENILLQMANTPIPVETTTSMTLSMLDTTNNHSDNQRNDRANNELLAVVVDDTTIVRHLLCQEWGESTYMLQLKMLSQ